MILSICGGETLTLEDGTLGTFTDSTGKVVVLQVAGDCWNKVSAAIARADFDSTKEGHCALETTTTVVPAKADLSQVQVIQGVKICRDLSGRIVSCPPR